MVLSYGWAVLPDFMNRTKGRREVKELTGKSTVPVLVTDSGEVVSDSKNIIDWAKQHRAGIASPHGVNRTGPCRSPGPARVLLLPAYSGSQSRMNWKSQRKDSAR